MKKNTPILVTGAAGFIGSHICEQLLTHNYSVIALDDLSLGELINIPRHPNVRVIKCDLTNSKQTEKVISSIQPELIFHLAAWAHEGLSQFMPRKITETNYNSLLNLVIPAINYNLKKIVVFSSMSVYGNQEPPFNEAMPKKPVDVYGIAKAAMESVTEVLAQVHGFSYVIIRPHNVYGPRQSMTDPYRNVVAIFINRMLQKKPFYIYGNGEQKRAFTYIDDLTRYVIKCGLDEQIKNQIYNLGPRKEYTINELAQVISNVFHSKLKPKYLAKRPVEVDDAYCTSTKAEKELGYNAQTDLITGITKTIEWAKTIGFRKPKYLTEIEITSDLLPKTWQKKLI